MQGDSNTVRDGGSSRFSQWFKRVGGGGGGGSGEPSKQLQQNSDSRRSSLHEDIHNMLKGRAQKSIFID